MDVVLQARAWMIAREIDLTAWDEEAPMDEFDDSIGEVAGEVGSVVGGAIFTEAARDEDLGEAIGQRELDVGVRFVITEKDVKTRLALLDEIVFECECFVLVGNEDVVDVYGFAHERAGFCIRLGCFK